MEQHDHRQQALPQTCRVPLSLTPLEQLESRFAGAVKKLLGELDPLRTAVAIRFPLVRNPANRDVTPFLALLRMKVGRTHVLKVRLQFRLHRVSENVLVPVQAKPDVRTVLTVADEKEPGDPLSFLADPNEGFYNVKNDAIGGLVVKWTLKVDMCTQPVVRHSRSLF
jgi:hypothetical protein